MSKDPMQAKNSALNAQAQGVQMVDDLVAPYRRQRDLFANQAAAQETRALNLERQVQSLQRQVQELQQKLATATARVEKEVSAPAALEALPGGDAPANLN